MSLITVWTFRNTKVIVARTRMPCGYWSQMVELFFCDPQPTSRGTKARVGSMQTDMLS